MSQLKTNILANFIGQAWTGLLGLALLPIYLRYLGVEAYGLVGLFAAIQAIATVLDLGLSTTVNREVAQRSSNPESGAESCSLVRTLEVIYWGNGLLIAVGIVAVSNWIATSWINVKELSESIVRLAVLILAISLIVRWPVSLYRGILFGMEKQVLLNSITVIIATLRSVGALLVLIFVSPTITAFLLWQLLVQAIEVFLFAHFSWKYLSITAKGYRATFKPSMLRPIWRFAGGMTGISILVIILTQLDKILISKLLPIEQLGYYTVAAALSSGMYLLVTPIFNAVFPRFSYLYATNDFNSLTRIYHNSAQLVSLISAPVAGVLVFFSHDILLLWTRSDTVAMHASGALSFLVIGFLMNAMMNVPYALQLAAGLVRIPLYVNIFSVILIVPLIIVFVNLWGITGAAVGWAALNTLYYLVTPHIMHRYVLKGEKLVWIFKDTLPFILGSMILFFVMNRLSTYFEDYMPSIIFAMIGFIVYGIVALFIFRKNFWSFINMLPLRMV